MSKFARRILLILVVSTIAMLSWGCADAADSASDEAALLAKQQSAAYERMEYWLLHGGDALAEGSQEIVFRHQSVSWGQSPSGGRWLLFCQEGRLPEKVQLVQCEIPVGLDEPLLLRGTAEMLRLVEGRRVGEGIFSGAYLLFYGLQKTEQRQLWESLWPEGLCSVMDLRYGEHSLLLAANSDIVLQAAAHTAAELSIPVGLDPLASLGLDTRFFPESPTLLQVSGGGRRLFDLALRMLYRMDGQELPAEAQNLNFSLWGRIISLSALQRFWLLPLASAGCLLALKLLRARHRRPRLLVVVAVPLATLSVGIACRIGGATNFADICLLWLAIAALLLALPLRLRRLLCLVQLLMLLSLAAVFWSTAPIRLELLALWLVLHLAWGGVFLS